MNTQKRESHSLPLNIKEKKRLLGKFNLQLAEEAELYDERHPAVIYRQKYYNAVNPNEPINIKEAVERQKKWYINSNLESERRRLGLISSDPFVAKSERKTFVRSLERSCLSEHAGANKLEENKSASRQQNLKAMP